MKQTEEKHLEAAHEPVSKAGLPCIRPEAAKEAEISRLAELEMENRRLNRLVAELVIQNQQLRNRSQSLFRSAEQALKVKNRF